MYYCYLLLSFQLRLLDILQRGQRFPQHVHLELDLAPPRLFCAVSPCQLRNLFRGELPGHNVGDVAQEMALDGLPQHVGEVDVAVDLEKRDVSARASLYKEGKRTQ